MSINPAELVLSEPVVDHDPGWAERVGAIGYPDAETVRVYHEVSPGGIAVIPPQDCPIKITLLPGGSCRIEADPDGAGPGHVKIIGAET